MHTRAGRIDYGLRRSAKIDRCVTVRRYLHARRKLAGYASETTAIFLNKIEK
jgi:hypothetical protein